MKLKYILVTLIVDYRTFRIFIYIFIYVTCSNEMSRMSRKIKIELVTPLEIRCINLSNGVTIMKISHTQPKLLDAEHA